MIDFDALITILFIVVLAYSIRAKAEVLAKVVRAIATILLAIALIYLIILFTPQLRGTLFADILRGIISWIMSFLKYVGEKLGGGV